MGGDMGAMMGGDVDMANEAPAGAGAGAGAGADGDGGPLAALRDHPQFDALRLLVQRQPSSLQAVLQQIGQQSPELLNLIHAHQDEFIRLMNEASAPHMPLPPLPQRRPAPLHPPPPSPPRRSRRAAGGAVLRRANPRVEAPRFWLCAPRRAASRRVAPRTVHLV